MSWTPLRRIPDADSGLKQIYDVAGMEADNEAWSNDQYEVFVRYVGDVTPVGRPEDGEAPEVPTGRRGFCQLSIKRKDREPARDFRHLQQIKNEVLGEEREALEIFPRESRLVDGANQTHLWVFPDGLEIPMGFPTGGVTSDDQTRELNRMRQQGQGNAKQRPWERGLTTGRNDNSTVFTDEQYAPLLDTMRKIKAGER